MKPRFKLTLQPQLLMLQKTLLRLRGVEHSPPIVVCNNEHRFIVAEQARQIGLEDLSIILEPLGRNTAPAIAVAAIHALMKQQDPVLLVLSADHEITDENAFRDAVRQASVLAERGRLVTFGITAARGYYQADGHPTHDALPHDARSTKKVVQSSRRISEPREV